MIFVSILVFLRKAVDFAADRLKGLSNLPETRVAGGRGIEPLFFYFFCAQ